MKEFDSLFRLGDQHVAPHTIEIQYDGTWMSVISVYASPGGGRMWVRAPEKMAKISFGARDELGRKVDDAVVEDISGRTFNLSLSDPKITLFRCHDKVDLLSDKEMAAWGVDYAVKFETRTFPACAESRVTPTHHVPTAETEAVDNSVEKSSRGNKSTRGIKFSVGDADNE